MSILVCNENGFICITMPLDEAKELTEQLSTADYEFDCLTDEVAPLMKPLTKALMEVVDPVLHASYYGDDDE